MQIFSKRINKALPHKVLKSWRIASPDDKAVLNDKLHADGTFEELGRGGDHTQINWATFSLANASCVVAKHGFCQDQGKLRADYGPST